MAPVKVAAVALPTPAEPPAPVVKDALLDVSSEPAGASVRAGGRKLGVTPLTAIALAPGSYDVVVEKKGYKPAHKSARLVAGETASVSAELQALPSKRHILVLNDNVGTWATLKVDGTVVGDTHTVQRTVEPGSHVIEARREGYQPVTRAVTIQPGETRKVTLELKKP